MNKLHQKLMTKWRWYSYWHNGSGCSRLHFLLLFLVVFGALFLNTIVIKGTLEELNSINETVTDPSRYLAFVGRNQDEKLNGLTFSILKLNNAYAKAPTERKEQVLSELRGLLEERQALMLEAIANQPELVLANAIPSGLQDRLPAELRGLLEKSVTVEGKVESLIADDFERGKSEIVHSLVDQRTGERLNLHFRDPNTKFNSGDRLRVQGVRLNNEIAADTTTTTSTTTTTTTTGTLAFSATPIVKKVAVILINFQNTPIASSSPWTVNTVRSTVFTGASSVKAYYREASFGPITLEGKLSPDGDIYGWYTIPYPDTICQNYNSGITNSTLTIAANNAASTTDGFSVSGYDNIIYAFPKTSACGNIYAGLGEIMGKLSWIQGVMATRPIVHELGHNYGAHHSSAWNCTNSGARVSISDTCTIVEYGDPFDTMGAYAPEGSNLSRHFNNFQKSRLNYYSQTANTLDVINSGTYTIVPIEQLSSGVQVLRIPRTFDTNNNSIDYYYLEYRRPFGFDNFVITNPVVNGVTIRVAPINTINNYAKKSAIIDTTPLTATTSIAFNDAPLLLNQTFQDINAGITISVVGLTSTEAKVQVTRGPVTATCTRANPGLTVTPLTQNGFAGDTLSYTLNITNNDSTACAPVTINVNHTTLPTGFMQTPASLSQTLSPGSSVSVPVLITSPLTATFGNKTITETAVSSAGASYSRDTSFTYSVVEPDVTQPSVTITQPANNASFTTKNKININATASDQGGIDSIKIFADGALLKTCPSVTTCSYNWTLTNVTAGAHVIEAVALDKASLSTSTSITVSVTASGSGSGKGNPH